MFGSIVGDVIGSAWEGVINVNPGENLFSRHCEFTDDSVCVAAIADALMNDTPIQATLRKWVVRYPNQEYGAKFKFWALQEDSESYGSWGNGGAMRISPVALLYRDTESAIREAERITAVSHSHPDAMNASRWLTIAISMALAGQPQGAIEAKLRSDGVGLQDLETYRAQAEFSTDAKDTIGPAIMSALSAHNFEGAMRNALSIGGDTDTIACMAGGLAEALFGIPDAIRKTTLEYLSEDIVEIMQALYRTAGIEGIGLPAKVMRGDEEPFRADKGTEKSLLMRVMDWF